MKRRDALKFLGLGSGAAMGPPWRFTPEKITRYFPYVREYDYNVYGVPNWYATTCRECPAGCGMLVKTIDNRPIKAEGNPDHPINRGGLCALGQASLQGMYHPRRFKGPLKREGGKLQETTWDAALAELAQGLAAAKGKVAILTGITGPTLGGVMDDFLAAAGGGTKVVYEPLAMESWRAANREMFNRDEVPAVLFDQAGCVVSIGGDFLEAGPSRVEHAWRLAEARAKWGSGGPRFIHLGPRMNLTAANADWWVPIRPGTELYAARAITLSELDIVEQILPQSDPVEYEQKIVQQILRDVWRPWIGTGPDAQQCAQAAGITVGALNVIARMLIDHTGPVTIGPAAGGGSELWKLINFLNAGNKFSGGLNFSSSTIRFGGEGKTAWGSYQDLVRLTEKMESGEIDTLYVHGIDPLALPLQDRFAKALTKVRQVVSFSPLPSGLSEFAHLLLPTHHFLEAWDDYLPRGGIVGLVQPTRRPLYDTVALGDVLLSLRAKLDPATAAMRYVDELAKSWTARSARVEGGASWDFIRQNGGLWSESWTDVDMKLVAPEGARTSPAPSEELALTAFASPLMYDGRGEDRPWLREIADPMAKIAYDAWVELHPDTARKLGVGAVEVVEVKTAHGSGRWPVRITRAIAPGVVGVPISPGSVIDGKPAGSGMGLLPAAPDADGCLNWAAGPVTVTRVGGPMLLPFEQNGDDQVGRGIGRYTDFRALSADREEWKKEHSRRQPPRTNMYPPVEYPGYKWGMVIDLERCVGCNACVAACYAENNLPIVGRAPILRHREMGWIRIERFFEEADGRLRPHLVPMLCQHCDNAPCESVCPVFASVHTREGLNAQIYNRCVGTRFCSNNCPYKVRRFNWFGYSWEEPLQLQLNPDVTVREKGVMEKCTFCIQRIVAAKRVAALEHRKLKDGEVRPACAQSCPARAITFGDLNDPASAVSRLRKDPRGYTILGDLNTRPAITYLARVARP